MFPTIRQAYNRNIRATTVSGDQILDKCTYYLPLKQFGAMNAQQLYELQLIPNPLEFSNYLITTLRQYPCQTKADIRKYVADTLPQAGSLCRY